MQRPLTPFSGPRSALLRYGVSFVAIALAVVIRLPFNPIFSIHVPFMFLFGAVTASAWFGGRGPGLVATALGVVSTWFFFMPPRQSFALKEPADVVQLGAFAVMGGVVALLSGSLRMSNEAVREREERLNAMALTVPEILFTADGEGATDYVSARFVEYSGRSRSALVPWGWLEVVHPEDRERAAITWRRCVETASEYQNTFRLRRWDGVYRWFQSHAVPLGEGRSGVTRWFGVCADIDDHKRMEEQLSHQTEELARSNEDLQRFASVASHDLKAPLRNIIQLSQILQRSYRGKVFDGGAEELLKTIDTSAEHMMALISDLLQYAKLSSAPGLPVSPTDAGSALEIALTNLRSEITESGAVVITLAALPSVNIEQMFLVQLFQNLIGNAIKYRADNVACCVHIAAEEHEGCHRFLVKDNGIGIEERFQERIFEPFKRLHGADVPGTGIGLAICKKIVEGAGGRIWVESQPGRGSSFFFTLPVLRSNAGRFEKD